ncbi:MAG: O-antigen ligase family protein [Pseudomonadota bacterium]|nr:O-antigen ligase family protein [Pseudomonadota bacterium]
MLGALVGIFSIGLVVDRSVAGIGLLLPAIVATVAVYATARSDGRRRGLIVGAALACILTASASFALLSSDALRSKFRDTPGSRTLATPTTLNAARDFLPMGSGLGSFVDVYGGYERPRFVSQTYMNHAHDDVAEVILELGAPAIALMTAFAIWFIWLAYRVWSSDERADAPRRAASVAILLMAAHSVVDYPLRTSAMASIFALCCAVLLSQSQVWMTGLSFPRSRRR